MNNRPDLLSEASLVRAFKIYLGHIKTPSVTLSAPTTSLVIDPSVLQKIFRWTKSGHLLLLLSLETLLSIKKPIKLLSLLSRSFTILFVELESTHLLVLTIWIQFKVPLDTLLKIQKTFNLFLLINRRRSMVWEWWSCLRTIN